MEEFGNIEDFFVDEPEPITLDPEVEKAINKHMEKFEIERCKREAEAIEKSKHIYLTV